MDTTVREPTPSVSAVARSVAAFGAAYSAAASPLVVSSSEDVATCGGSSSCGSSHQSTSGRSASVRREARWPGSAEAW